MKRFLVISAICMVLGSAVPLARAHVYQYAGTLSVLLHMEPNDDPIASEPAQLFFYFKDSAEKFKLSGCLCRASIVREGKEIFSTDLQHAPADYGSDVRLVNFTFPDIGIYTVKLDGRAERESFDPFSVKYDVRIDKVPPGGIKKPVDYTWWWVGGGGIIILSMAAALGLRRSRPT